MYLLIVALIGLFAAGVCTNRARVALDRLGRPEFIRPTTGVDLIVGFLTVLFGAVTLMVFVPGGVLFAIISADGSGLNPLVTIGLPLVCATGLIFAVNTFSIPTKIALRDRAALRPYCVFTVLHHIGVAIVFATTDMAVVVLIPCAIGIALGAGGLHLARPVRTLPRAEVVTAAG